MKELRALIFDMDGTLLDSEGLWLRADLAVVVSYGGTMSEEEHHSYVGVGAKEFLRLVKEKFPIQASLEELEDFQLKTYWEMARKELKAFPEMVALARWADGKGIKKAIASGSPPKLIEEMTELTGIKDLFPLRLSSEMVGKGKPAPDVFLKAAELLQVDPGTCLVFEDSPFGVEAARRAGMASVAVPLPSVVDPKGFLAGATRVVPGGIPNFRCADIIPWIEGEFQLP